MSTTGIAFKHTSKEIVITKTFAKAANVLNSPAYRTLQRYQADFPKYSIVLRSVQKKKESKVTYRGLSYETMAYYIAQNVPVEHQEEALAALEKEKKNPRYASSPYAHVKKWFLDKYPDYKPTANQEDLTSDNRTEAADK